MGIEGEWDNPKYQGIHKYFNSYTIRGRSNWCKAVFAFYGLIFVAYKTTRHMWRKPSEEPKKTLTDPESVDATTPEAGPPESTYTSHCDSAPPVEPGPERSPSGPIPQEKSTPSQRHPGHAPLPPGWYYFSPPLQAPPSDQPLPSTNCIPYFYLYCPCPNHAPCFGQQKDTTYASPNGKKAEEETVKR